MQKALKCLIYSSVKIITDKSISEKLEPNLLEKLRGKIIYNSAENMLILDYYITILVKQQHLCLFVCLFFKIY